MAKQHNDLSLVMRKQLVDCLRKHGASPDDAEDAIQSALLAYYERSDAADIINMEGWLMRVASDDWKDICRLKTRWVALNEWQSGGSELGLWEDRVLSKLVLLELLARLSAVEREILDYEARGFSREEMAACLGVTKEAIKKRLYRARHKARELYTSLSKV